MKNLKYQKTVKIQNKKGERIQYIVTASNKSRLLFEIARLKYLFEPTVKTFQVSGKHND